LFRVLHATGESKYSWYQISESIKSYTAGLAKLATDGESEALKIAFLLENSIEMALLDLSCLTGGIVNIMIPANSVPQQIEFILNQTKAGIVLAMNDKQLVISVKGLTKKFGDFVALQDHDNSYGRAFVKGALSIGVVVHSDCLLAGHGPGIATLMTCSMPLIEPVIDSDANIAVLLKIGTERETF
jgi:long-subunit acyl-CoA synthetase (AMP-forming)